MPQQRLQIDGSSRPAGARSNGAWRVAKFGGTSVGTPSNWPHIAKIVRAHLDDGVRPLLVCSALSGVTDQLERLLAALDAGDDATPVVRALVERHAEAARAMGVLGDDLPELRWLEDLGARRETPTPRLRAQVLAAGERLSTRLAVRYLRAEGLDAGWVDVQEVLHATSDGRGAADYLSAECEYAPDAALQARLGARREAVLVTQGFTASNDRGETVVLGRGGSDTSAAYLASLLDADRLEIWTDVPGTFTTNPKLVPEARLIRTVAIDEVATMAALGAKVLHPRSLEVPWRYGVPLEVRWTQRPELGAGTRITADGPPGAKAVAARRNLVAFVVERDPSWQPIGFMADVASCFSELGISMDLVSSSPGAIKVTVDRVAVPHIDDLVDELVKRLEETCRVTALGEVASVSFVGRSISRQLDVIAGALDAVAPDSLYFVNHSSEDLHVTYVIDASCADAFVRAAHERLFEDHDTRVFGPTWTEIAERRPSAPRAPERERVKLPPEQRATA